MRSEPEVSVVLAIYNGIHYLKPQLDSILVQLSPADELLVMDDGSTDGSLQLIAAYAEKWPQIQLFEGQHCGVVQNFASGIEKARGKYIFLADQDDVWEAKKREAVCQILKNEKRPAAVLHDAVFMDADGNLLSNTLFQWRQVRTGFIKNWMKNSYMGCCMAFNRELIPYILPFPRRLPMHDQWIGLMAERYGRVYLLRESMLRYRRHEQTVTKDHHSSLYRMLKWRMIVLFQYIKRSIRR